MSVHGVLNINKPAGLTSRQVVDRVRRILKTRKAGHAGTLDPDATGVLLICLGDATKLFEHLQEGEKEYEAVLTLGIATDTQDASGKITRVADAGEVTEEHIIAAFKAFEGEIEQIPPMFSAVKYKGKPLYKLARKGLQVERPPRQVRIYQLEILAIDKPEVRFLVRCSKGTYIRTLAADIGEALGCGAHLSELMRTRSGIFPISDAIPLATIEACPEVAHKAIYSIDEVMQGHKGNRVKGPNDKITIAP